MYKSKKENILNCIFYFPIWWFRKLPIKIFLFIIDIFRSNFKKFGIKFLLRNIFKPLFGFKNKIDHFVSIIVRIGHFFIIFLSSFLQSLIFSSIAIFIFLSPILALFEIFSLSHFFDIPKYFYLLIIFNRFFNLL
jgi:hypothetical protein